MDETIEKAAVTGKTAVTGAVLSAAGLLPVVAPQAEGAGLSWLRKNAASHGIAALLAAALAIGGTYLGMKPPKPTTGFDAAGHTMQVLTVIARKRIAPGPSGGFVVTGVDAATVIGWLDGNGRGWPMFTVAGDKIEARMGDGMTIMDYIPQLFEFKGLTNYITFVPPSAPPPPPVPANVVAPVKVEDEKATNAMTAAAAVKLLSGDGSGSPAVAVETNLGKAKQ